MLTLIHKYGKTAAIVATQSLNDRSFGMLGMFVIQLSQVVILLALWHTVMSGQGEVSGMSLEAVLTYTLIAAVFGGQLGGRIQIDNDLWSGNIAHRFLRPLGIYGQMLAEMVADHQPIHV